MSLLVWYIVKDNDGLSVVSHKNGEEGNVGFTGFLKWCKKSLCCWTGCVQTLFSVSCQNYAYMLMTKIEAALKYMF